jgi:hypothetical protein
MARSMIAIKRREICALRIGTGSTEPARTRRMTSPALLAEAKGFTPVAHS